MCVDACCFVPTRAKCGRKRLSFYRERVVLREFGIGGGRIGDWRRCRILLGVSSGLVRRLHFTRDIGQSTDRAVEDGRDINARAAFDVFESVLELFSALLERQVVVGEVERVSDTNGFQRDIRDTRQDGHG